MSTGVLERPSSGGGVSIRSGSVVSVEGKSQNENSFYTECKTTYLSMFKSIDDRILSRQHLYDLLVRSGRSPSKSSMSGYWSEGTTDYLSYTQFCAIMRKEKPVSKNDIIALFHSLDSKDEGVIGEEKLTKLLTGYGEAFSPSEMKQLLALMQNYSSPTNSNSAGGGGSGAYSYTKFASSIIESRSECATRHKILLAHSPSSDSSSHPLRDKGGTSSSNSKSVMKLRSKLQPKSFNKWGLKVTRKGHLRVDGKMLHSTSYTLSLSSSCSVFMSAEPVSIVNCNKMQDCLVLLLCVKMDQQGNLVSEGSSSNNVFLSDCTDGEKFYLKADLVAGNYVIIPFTFSSCLSPRKSHSHSARQIDLVQQPEGGGGGGHSKDVSVECVRAIETLFELVDLDGDGAISREELDLFQMCCSGEKFSDEDWNALKSMWEVVDDCITHRGFVDLHRMEADGDPTDLWNSFTKMGFNNDLLLDECCPIKIEFAAEKEGVLKIGIEKRCRSMKEVETVICNFAATLSKQKGSCSSKTKSYEDVNITTFKSNQLGFICVNNSGRNSRYIRLDLSSSSNLKLVSNYTDIAVPANTTKVAQLCVPTDASKEIIIKMAAEVKN